MQIKQLLLPFHNSVLRFIIQISFCILIKSILLCYHDTDKFSNSAILQLVTLFFPLTFPPGFSLFIVLEDDMRLENAHTHKKASSWRNSGSGTISRGKWTVNVEDQDPSSRLRVEGK